MTLIRQYIRMSEATELHMRTWDVSNCWARDHFGNESMDWLWSQSADFTSRETSPSSTKTSWILNLSLNLFCDSKQRYQPEMITVHYSRHMGSVRIRLHNNLAFWKTSTNNSLPSFTRQRQSHGPTSLLRIIALTFLFYISVYTVMNERALLWATLCKFSIQTSKSGIILTR